MRILVTGGTGFIGSHIVDQLVAEGHDVHILDLRPSDLHPELEFHQADIRDLEAVSRALSGMDVVYHLASVADVRNVDADPLLAESVNVRGTLTVAKACQQTAGLQRLIYASTTWVYAGTQAEPADETARLSPPDHFYTATKLIGEWYVKFFHEKYGLPFTILRYGIPYGPRARDGTVISYMIEKAKNREPLTIAGNGQQFRNFLYIGDLARGNVLALQKEAANQIYNLDGRRQVTIRQLAEKIREVVRDVPIEHVAARPGDFSGRMISSEKAQQELGWVPKVELEVGLRQYIDWKYAQAPTQ